VREIVILRKAVEYVEGRLRKAGWKELRLLDS
jgi:broad-specificity NMP kinase